jgi:uncharacterized membrane protein YecN with MAPEG domain
MSPVAFFTDAAPLSAAAVYLGLLVFVMLGLKLFVGMQRGRMGVPSGDTSNVEFGRMLRVQHNAVEDVPVLMVGLLALALLDAPLWLIHAGGATLVVARLVHAVGLAGSGGLSIGRAVGTLGSLLCYTAIGGGLVWTAFQAPA